MRKQLEIPGLGNRTVFRPDNGDEEEEEDDDDEEEEDENGEEEEEPLWDALNPRRIDAGL